MSKFKQFRYYKNGVKTKPDESSELVIINTDHIIFVETGPIINSMNTAWMDLNWVPEGTRLLVKDTLDDVLYYLNEP